MNPTKKKIAVLLILFFGLTLGVSFFYYLKTQSQKTITLDSPKGGNYNIPSTHGEFKLADQIGKKTFIFFGFTHCPDICPTALKNLQDLKKSLTPEEQNKLTVLFISVDPERDTIDVLKDRLSKYESNFIGATTTDEELNKILKMYGARFTKLKNPKTSEIYIDHTSQIFVINSKGEWSDVLKHSSPVAELKDAFMLADQRTLQAAVEKKRRIIPVLAEAMDCDLSLQDCELRTFSQETIKMKISPHPIEIEKDLSVQVTLTSKIYTPVEIDIEGVELNMGLIRPKLKLSKDTKTYIGDFYLPLCELDTMNWVARLIVKGPNNEVGAFNFHFKTNQ